MTIYENKLSPKYQENWRIHGKSRFQSNSQTCCHFLDHERTEDIGSKSLGSLSFLIVPWGCVYAADEPDCGTADPLILTNHYLQLSLVVPQRWPELMNFSVPHKPFIYGTTQTKCQFRISFERGYKSAWAIILKLILIIFFINPLSSWAQRKLSKDLCKCEMYYKKWNIVHFCMWKSLVTSLCLLLLSCCWSPPKSVFVSRNRGS